MRRKRARRFTLARVWYKKGRRLLLIFDDNLTGQAVQFGDKNLRDSGGKLGAVVVGSGGDVGDRDSGQAVELAKCPIRQQA